MRGREEAVLLQEYLGSVLYSITVFAVWEIIMANFMTRRFSVKTTILLWAAAGLVYFVLPQFVLPYGTLLRAFTALLPLPCCSCSSSGISGTRYSLLF